MSRQDFSLGWQPSADAFACPPNGFLRFDNLTLDELGAVSLRPGSAKINSSAFSSTDIHSLFTATISGTRYRMAGATDAVFANGTSVASSLNGSNDVSFGAHMGHILFARGTSKKKYDGTTVRNWGIAAPGAAATLAGIAADSKVFASCASTESPIMTVNEGTLAFQPNSAGTASAAVELTPDATTARSTATKTFASPTDFTAYDGGQVGTGDDLIEMDVFVTEPQYMDRITLMIDVNDGTFQADYYQYQFINGEAVTVAIDPSNYLESDYTAEGQLRDDVLARLEERGITTTFRVDKPVTNTGWNHFSIPRQNFERIGSTSGKDFTTVKAVRVTFVGIAGGSGAAVRFDEIKIIGGAQRALTGPYKAIVVAARNDGTYNALSAPNTPSAEILVKGQGIAATLDATTVNALDTQVNELWLFLMGGRLDRFYLAKKLTGGPFSGSQTINATTSDRSMLIANIPLETDNAQPPDTIIGIEGPHYDRTLTLTAQFIYPSRERNPDSYSAGQAIRIGDAAETGLWIKKLNEQIYVGTTRDIYRMDGDWTPLPDGTINVSKRPLGVQPPISSAVTVGTVGSSDILVYLTSGGWKPLGGPHLTEGVDLLWRGQTRHGVSPVNVSTSTSRFRCSIAKNVFYAITPEGSDTTSSATIHVFHFGKNRWYRFTYPQAFRSLISEPDGTLISGDASGFVRTMDEATHTDDGTGIPVVWWTRADDDNQPFSYKEAMNLQIRANTDGGTASIAFHLDGSSTANATVTTAQSITDTGVVSIAAVSQATQFQMRLTGSFSTFTLRGWAISYRDNPMPLVVHDTNYVDLTTGGMAWVRRIRVKANSPVDMTLMPYYDGSAGTARTISVGAYANKVYTFEVPLGRDDKGRTARFTVETSSPSQVYWVEAEFNDSGKVKQKRISLVPQVSA